MKQSNQGTRMLAQQTPSGRWVCLMEFYGPEHHERANAAALLLRSVMGEIALEPCVEHWVDGTGYGWTQPQCFECFSETNEGMPVRTNRDEPEIEQCCTCGRKTIEGIYTRKDPSKVPFPKNNNVHEQEFAEK